MTAKRKKTYTKRAPTTVASSTPARAVQTRSFSSQGLENFRSRLPNFIIGVVAVFAFVSLVIMAVQKTPSKALSKQSFFSFFSNQKKADQTMNAKKADDQMAGSTYVVKEGDYLWNIAEQAYGSGFNAYDIARANNLLEPYVVVPGQRLMLPKVKPQDPTVGEVPTQLEPTITKAVTTAKTYVIKDGDYLAQIAQEVYGQSDLWPSIYEANKAQIADPNYVEVGQKLIIPPNPPQLPAK